MLRIGLTGGISSGKSTICKWFKERGFLVIDADQVAHQLISKGQICFKPIVSRFGKRILDSTGEIDRKSLGNLVFNDVVCLKKLNELVHPHVTKKILQQLKNLEEIELYDNRIRHIDNINHLHKMIFLDISFNRVKEIRCID